MYEPEQQRLVKKEIAKNRDRSSFFLAIMVIFQIVILVTVILTLFQRDGFNGDQRRRTDADGSLDFADMLYAQELYEPAAKEYAAALNRYELEPQQAANISYKIGEIYLEKLNRYTEALSYFLKAEFYDKSGKLAESITTAKIHCLERMKRSTDAQRILEKQALLDSDGAARPEQTAPVAIIGTQTITVGQFERYCDRLPKEVKEQFQTREGKIELLRQYIATELIYNAAKRKGYESDPELNSALTNFEKSLYVQKYIQEELGDKVVINLSELELYYQAHKKEFGDKPFDEVKEEVASHYQQVKSQEALATLFTRLSQAEEVTLFPENITD